MSILVDDRSDTIENIGNDSRDLLCFEGRGCMENVVMIILVVVVAGLFRSWAMGNYKRGKTLMHFHARVIQILAERYPDEYLVVQERIPYMLSPERMRNAYDVHMSPKDYVKQLVLGHLRDKQKQGDFPGGESEKNSDS